ncbi:hypothetical protein BGZ83_000743 [Gryganskiella cystojenkinii]|nr:hypothetical protein BGZ83_000743 [Gryganskiella cystojenkinii]
MSSTWMQPITKVLCVASTEDSGTYAATLAYRQDEYRRPNATNYPDWFVLLRTTSSSQNSFSPLIATSPSGIGYREGQTIIAAAPQTQVSVYLDSSSLYTYTCAVNEELQEFLLHAQNILRSPLNDFSLKIPLSSTILEGWYLHPNVTAVYDRTVSTGLSDDDHSEAELSQRNTRKTLIPLKNLSIGNSSDYNNSSSGSNGSKGRDWMLVKNNLGTDKFHPSFHTNVRDGFPLEPQSSWTLPFQPGSVKSGIAFTNNTLYYLGINNANRTTLYASPMFLTKDRVTITTPTSEHASMPLSLNGIEDVDCGSPMTTLAAQGEMIHIACFNNISELARRISYNVTLGSVISTNINFRETTSYRRPVWDLTKAVSMAPVYTSKNGAALNFLISSGEEIYSVMEDGSLHRFMLGEAYPFSSLPRPQNNRNSTNRGRLTGMAIAFIVFGAILFLIAVGLALWYRKRGRTQGQAEHQQDAGEGAEEFGLPKYGERDEEAPPPTYAPRPSHNQDMLVNDIELSSLHRAPMTPYIDHPHGSSSVDITVAQDSAQTVPPPPPPAAAAPPS